jgi:hypothetical protein
METHCLQKYDRGKIFEWGSLHPIEGREASVTLRIEMRSESKAED